MYYLHITTHTPAAERPVRPSPTQGPFATEQEARGYFTKLTLWYPGTMREAEYQIVYRNDAATERDRRIPN